MIDDLALSRRGLIRATGLSLAGTALVAPAPGAGAIPPTPLNTGRVDHADRPPGGQEPVDR